MIVFSDKIINLIVDKLEIYALPKLRRVSKLYKKIADKKIAVLKTKIKYEMEQKVGTIKNLQVYNQFSKMIIDDSAELAIVSYFNFDGIGFKLKIFLNYNQLAEGLGVENTPETETFIRNSKDIQRYVDVKKVLKKGVYFQLNFVNRHTGNYCKYFITDTGKLSNIFTHNTIDNDYVSLILLLKK
jgi:hypothetical protein